VPALENKTANALFRIAQEALNNIAKHAQAQKVTISLSEQEKCVRLTIEDDGIGFSVNGKNAGNGWGQIIMAERAEAVNGHFRINSSLAQGTQVITEIPR
jgi:signal transduction histidine kinase